MVVLTIVGLAGLAGMMSIIDNGEHAMPRPVHANIKSGDLILLSALEDFDDINLTVEAINSEDGAPLRKASVALTGLGAASVNITDINGLTILRFKKTDFKFNAEEGYLGIEVRAAGFQDYSNK